MAIHRYNIKNIFEHLSANLESSKLGKERKHVSNKKKSRLLHDKVSKENIIDNWKVLKESADLSDEDQNVMADPLSLEDAESYSHNIENCIGTVKLPVGIAGPININGMFAQGEFYLPLATTEAALVASYNRGTRLINEAGGCTAMVLNDSITRAPGFMFNTLVEVSQFIVWVNDSFGAFKKVAESTTNHGKLIDIRTNVEGNHVYLNFDYQTVGLKIVGLQGGGCVHAFAEICAACCLAGELSIVGAMCAGDFASAHQRLARG